MVKKYDNSEHEASDQQRESKCSKSSHKVDVLSFLSGAQVYVHLRCNEVDGINKGYYAVEEEENKQFLRVESHTVIHPSAVMVHHYNTATTLITVVHVWWLQ